MNGVNYNEQIRIDHSRVMAYVGPDIPKPGFWDRVKKGFVKLGSAVGSMATFVGPLFGPVGFLAAAAGYGVRNVSNRALGSIAAKENYDYAQSQQPVSVATPGLFEEPAPSPFAAPSFLEPNINTVIINKDATTQAMMRSL